MLCRQSLAIKNTEGRCHHEIEEDTKAPDQQIRENAMNEELPPEQSALTRKCLCRTARQGALFKSSAHRK